MKYLQIALACLLIAALTGCAGRSGETPAETATTPAEPTPADFVNETDAEIAALLLLADDAFRAKRLTTPYQNNAHHYLQRILALDADHAEAQLRLTDIIEQYIDWALSAAEDGYMGAARNYLQQAETVLPGHPSLARAQQRVGSLADSVRESISIRHDQLAARSEALVKRLSRFGARAESVQAEVVIRAPSDADARWIYQTMNAVTTRARLSARMHTAAIPSVELIYQRRR